MRLLRALRVLLPIDLRNLRRDPLLGWIVVYPLAFAILLRVGTEPLAGWLARGQGFDLEPYYPLLASFVVGLAPGMAGTVIGFLLLDERDERTLSALLVTPLPIGTYLAYRLATPSLLGLVVTVGAYELAGLAPLPLPVLAGAATLAGLSAPVATLVLATFAENKVAGFALVKILSFINILPVVAWFLDMPTQLVAGLVPTYWPMKMVWVSASGGGVLPWALAGAVVNLVVIASLIRPFRRRAFRS